MRLLVPGSHRDGAEVIDLTPKVTFKGWPVGTPQTQALTRYAA